jgi:hypothetical protein
MESPSERERSRADAVTKPCRSPMPARARTHGSTRRVATWAGRSGTVSACASRPLIDLELALDGVATWSETTCTWAGAHVLSVHTVIPRSELALELHSTFIGHHGIPTHVVHLVLGPPGRGPIITASDDDGDELDPTYAPRGCAYEHAQQLIEVLASLGYRATLEVPGEDAFESLERVRPRLA